MSAEKLRQAWWKWDYTAWLSDPNLRGCGMASHGLWINILGLCSQSEEPGYLIIKGKAPSLRVLSNMVGFDIKQVGRCLAELEEQNVCSRDERGVIYSRRMVSDYQAFLRNQSNGRRGGNPKLVKEGGNSVQTAENGGKRRKLAESGRQTASDNPSNVSQLPELPLNPPLKAEVQESESERGSPTDSLLPRVETPARNVVAFPLDPPRTPPSPPDLPELEHQAIAAWNRLASVSNISSVRGTVNGRRRTRLQARLRQWGLAGWMEALNRIEASDVWQGRTAFGWRPTIDDLVSEEKFQKVMEGGYDRSANRRVAEPGAPAPPRQSARWANLQTTLDGARPIAPTIDHVDDAVPTLDAKGMWG